MWSAEGFEYWWLVPFILIALCFVWSKGCCFRMRDRIVNDPERSDETALEILKKRYARGEIDDEEFERKSKLITRATKGAKNEWHSNDVR